MQKREKYRRLAVFGTLLLLSVLVWLADRREETPEDILEQVHLQWISTSTASERLKQMNLNVYAFLAAEMEVKDEYLRTKYIAAYAKLPEMLQFGRIPPLSDAQRSERAERMMQSLMDVEPEVKDVLDLLGNEHPQVRKIACRALYWRKWRTRKKEDGPWPQDVLIKNLQSDDEVVRDFVLHKFAELGEKSIVPQTHFTRFLHHKDEEVVLDAVKALLATDWNPLEAKPAFQKLVTSSTDEIRYFAASELRKIDAQNSQAMAAFMAFAQSTNTTYRPGALSELSLFGTNAAVYSSAVSNLFSDPNPDVRQAATNAFDRITPNIQRTESRTVTLYWGHVSFYGSRYSRKHLRY